MGQAFCINAAHKEWVPRQRFIAVSGSHCFKSAMVILPLPLESKKWNAAFRSASLTAIPPAACEFNALSSAGHRAAHAYDNVTHIRRHFPGGLVCHVSC